MCVVGEIIKSKNYTEKLVILDYWLGLIMVQAKRGV